MSGLLLCGAPGSGRTSVARSVAKKLEADSRIYACTPSILTLLLLTTDFLKWVLGVVYVDLAQMADEHTSALRAKFQTWRAVAAWRRPSVLILDNLDKVVSAEVEVCLYLIYQ